VKRNNHNENITLAIGLKELR